MDNEQQEQPTSEEVRGWLEAFFTEMVNAVTSCPAPYRQQFVEFLFNLKAEAERVSAWYKERQN